MRAFRTLHRRFHPRPEEANYSFLAFIGNTMSEKISRNRRLRKKLHLEEFAILGFEFSFKLASTTGDDYDQFFTVFAEFANAQHLYISLGNDNEFFEGLVTSADRYGNATEENRKAMETLLNTQAIVSEVKIGALVDACYGM
jgi:uncharacterized protein